LVPVVKVVKNRKFIILSFCKVSWKHIPLLSDGINKGVNLWQLELALPRGTKVKLFKVFRSNKLQAIPLASSFTLWTVVSIAEGLETFAERLMVLSIHMVSVEVQCSNSGMYFYSSKENLPMTFISAYIWLHQPPFPALHVQ